MPLESRTLAELELTARLSDAVWYRGGSPVPPGLPLVFTIEDGPTFFGLNFDEFFDPDTGLIRASALPPAGFSLSADADTNLLDLTSNVLGLDDQAANLIFSGPAAGGAVAPAFRAMVDADIPAAISRDIETIDTQTVFDAIVDGIGVKDDHFTTLQLAVDAGAQKIFYAVSTGEGTVTIAAADACTIIVGRRSTFSVSINVVLPDIICAKDMRFQDCLWSGTGLTFIDGASSPLFSVEFITCQWNQSTSPIVLGATIFPTARYTFLGCAFVSCVDAILISSSTVPVFITACEFRNNTGDAVIRNLSLALQIVGTNFTGSNVNDFEIDSTGALTSQISGCRFAVRLSETMKLGAESSVSGNTFDVSGTQSMSYCIEVGTGCVVSGNVFFRQTNRAYIKINGQGIVVGNNAFVSEGTTGINTITFVSEAVDISETVIDIKRDTLSNLAEDIAIGETEWDVTVGTGSFFAAPDFLRIDDEIVRVASVATDTLTVVRAQLGTVDAVHSNGQDIYFNGLAKATQDLEVGDILLMDSEQLEVTATFAGSQATMTVVRGVNGSVVATHTDETLIERGGHRAVFITSGADSAVIVGNSFSATINNNFIGVHFGFGAANDNAVISGNNFQTTAGGDLAQAVLNHTANTSLMANKGFGSRGPVLVPEIDNDQSLGSLTRRFATMFNNDIDLVRGVVKQLTNNEGTAPTTAPIGAVVIASGTAGFEGTTTDADATSIGVAVESIATSATGAIAYVGVVDVLCNGTVNVGDTITPSTTQWEGRARAAPNIAQLRSAVGKALATRSGGGSSLVSCLLK